MLLIIGIKKVFPSFCTLKIISFIKNSMHIDEAIKEKVTHLLRHSPRNMAHTLGIEFISFRLKEVKAVMPVDERTIQPFGILHGGASVALAETLASIGVWLNINETAKSAVGIEINANHIRSVEDGGRVTGTATPVKRGKNIHIWEVKIHSVNGKLVCVSRCTLAIIDKR